MVKAPDWFYVPQVQPVAEGVIRRSYTPHLQGSAIAVVMEFLSDEEGGELSLRSTPPYGKLYFYERILKVPTYVTYDPYELAIEVRQLQNGQYVLQTADANGRWWIPELELFLGIWEGERLCQTCHWLRWWDAAGNLLLWSAEQAEQERQARLGAVSKLLGMGLTIAQVAEALGLAVEEVQAVERTQQP